MTEREPWKEIGLMVTGISVTKHMAVVHAYIGDLAFPIPVSRATAEQLMAAIGKGQVKVRPLLVVAARIGRDRNPDPLLRMTKLDYIRGFAVATLYTTVGGVSMRVPLQRAHAQSIEGLLDTEVNCDLEVITEKTETG